MICRWQEMAFCLLNLGGLEMHEYLLLCALELNKLRILSAEEETTDVNNGLTIDFQRNSVRDLCKNVSTSWSSYGLIEKKF